MPNFCSRAQNVLHEQSGPALETPDRVHKPGYIMYSALGGTILPDLFVIQANSGVLGPQIGAHRQVGSSDVRAGLCSQAQTPTREGFRWHCSDGGNVSNLL